MLQTLYFKRDKTYFYTLNGDMKGYLAECDLVTPDKDELLAKPKNCEKVFTIPNAFSAFKRSYWKDNQNDVLS